MMIQQSKLNMSVGSSGDKNTLKSSNSNENIYMNISATWHWCKQQSTINFNQNKILYLNELCLQWIYCLSTVVVLNDEGNNIVLDQQKWELQS